VKLHRLHLVNFRQHADTDIALGDGLTGIIGPNGSGKTTLLEAISWAIYGPVATRGDKDSIRNLRAKPRASVRVELEFALGRHEYRVVRGLHAAELYEDGRPLANSIREVTDKLERLLGMGHDEFFNTYFTGQKELAVMASLGPTERAAFLSRVLGYERLRDAQDRVRERRNAAAAELKGLEAGLPDREEIARAREQALAELQEARLGERRAEAARADATTAVERIEPEWREWERKRELAIRLDSDRRMATHAVEAARHEFQRLDRELAEALHAQEQIRELQPDLEPIARLKDELGTLEALQREEAGRQADRAQLDELGRAAADLERRLAELGDRDAALATARRDVEAVARRLEEAERRVEEQRGGWLTERQYAETKRAELLRQWEDVKEQLDRIRALGPEGECPTCRRPLGEEYPAVIALLERQRDAITEDGKYFRRRLEQLLEEPAVVRDAEAARDAVAAEHTRAAEREGQVRAEAEERARGAQALADARRRAAQVEERLRARPTGYDAARHDALRAELARLEPVWREAARLEGIAGRAAVLVKEAELAEQQLSRREESARQIEAAVEAQGFSEDGFRRAKERHDQAMLVLKQAELSVAEARHGLMRAEERVREAERRETERAVRERHIAERRMEHRLHNELDRALSDLRGELNAAVRPEITELASAFLVDLTDGRYDEVELDENYRVRVLDEGVPKPVISGGEEDVANLVLRLAISQMIAERAGQPLSLLVLDEIFGSLDDQRRGHVLALLRRLADRFPQVVLITHVEGVREGLDRVLRVTYDAARATSVVRDETATLGPVDAGVAA
jgi:exonuclease SbcC